MNSQPSITTVTLNPAIDQTVFVPDLKPGRVHRAERSHRQAGGKGVNAATMLALGGANVAVSGFLGQDNTSIFEKHFRRHQLIDAFVRVSGETRTGIKIVDTKAGDTTDINLPGPAPTANQCKRLISKLLKYADSERWFLLAGSLPSGVEPAFLVELITALRSKGAKVAVDSSGPALAAAVEAGIDLAKPNHHELEELLGVKLQGFEDTLLAARTLRREKIPNLVVSLGDEGALFLTPDAELKASAPPVKVVSTVGAGDSLLAGFFQGLSTGESPADCARMATVYAWSRLESLVSALPEPALVRKRMADISVQSLTAFNPKA